MLDLEAVYRRARLRRPLVVLDADDGDAAAEDAVRFAETDLRVRILRATGETFRHALEDAGAGVARPPGPGGAAFVGVEEAAGTRLLLHTATVATALEGGALFARAGFDPVAQASGDGDAEALRRAGFVVREAAPGAPPERGVLVHVGPTAPGRPYAYADLRDSARGGAPVLHAAAPAFWADAIALAAAFARPMPGRSG